MIRGFLASVCAAAVSAAPTVVSNLNETLSGLNATSPSPSDTPPDNMVTGFVIPVFCMYAGIAVVSCLIGACIKKLDDTEEVVDRYIPPKATRPSGDCGPVYVPRDGEEEGICILVGENQVVVDAENSQSEDSVDKGEGSEDAFYSDAVECTAL